MRAETPFTVFGNIDDSGALLVLNGENDRDVLEAGAAMHTYPVREQARLRGHEFTPEQEVLLVVAQRASAARRRANIRAKGVPNAFKQLFAAKRKKDAARICAGMNVTQQELFELIFNSEQIGYSASRKFPKFIPEQLKPTKAEREAFWSNGEGSLSPDAKRFFKKTAATFEQRKWLNIHLFQKCNEWHCLFFDLNDTLIPEPRNHWKGGPHLHYISHLWGQSLDGLKDQFEQRTQLVTVHALSSRYALRRA